MNCVYNGRNFFRKTFIANAAVTFSPQLFIFYLPVIATRTRRLPQHEWLIPSFDFNQGALSKVWYPMAKAFILKCSLRISTRVRKCYNSFVPCNIGQKQQIYFWSVCKIVCEYALLRQINMTFHRLLQQQLSQIHDYSEGDGRRHVLGSARRCDVRLQQLIRRISVWPFVQNCYRWNIFVTSSNYGTCSGEVTSNSSQQHF